MRFQKSIKNLLVSWLGQVVYIVINLFARRIFVNTLGIEILGVSGLFSNILSFLSFAELGIASAVGYSLYKPLAENDIESIQKIMYFFKLAYQGIGCLILVIGTCLIPTLDTLVPAVSGINSAYVYYELFVINTAVSYFYTYKATLIEANQDRYLKIANHYFWVCLLGIIQIISLYYFQNYIIFLMLQVTFTLIENICVSKIADKQFPYLKVSKKQLPSKKILTEIGRNVIGTSLNKAGSVLVTATDNILISRFVGLIATGFYSNYTYVTNGIWQILIQIYAAIQSGIGDLNIREGTEYVKKIYKEIIFVSFIVFYFGFLVLLVCMQDIILIWIGETSILDISIVYVCLYNFLISGIRSANITFINALGLYWKGKYRVIIEGILNFILSVILGKYYGLIGVLLGTTISGIVTGFILEPYILCKHGFQSKVWFVWIPFLKYITHAVVFSTITEVICSSIAYQNIFITLFIKLIICFMVYFSSIYAVYKRTYEFKQLIHRVRNIKK